MLKWSGETEMNSNLIKELLRHLPSSPGVYLMRNDRGHILYVGKSANLSHRVRSYFASPNKLTPKTRVMVEQVNDFEYYITASEQEALILELTLVKRHQPPYNVMLKDGKSFPYLKLDLRENWPRLHITRRLEENDSRYFGPFANINSVRQTLGVLRRIFPLRSCAGIITGKASRPCLRYHMGQCLAPCTAQVSREEYTRLLQQVILFLEGKQEKVLRGLKKKMEEASRELDFERAARFRDQIQAVQDVVEGQQIAMTLKGEQDVIAFASGGDQACVQVFIIRGGKLIGRESFALKGTQSEQPTRIMTSFIELFFSSSPNIPPLILLQHPVENSLFTEEWLSKKRGTRVHIEVPQRGKKKQLVDIVSENAAKGLELLKIQQLAAPAAITQALEEIKNSLQLPRPPSRIECYDISNIQGQDAVGSMVVFQDGRPAPAHYRRFKIKTVAGANDYAMLQEMLRRRFKRSKPDDKPVQDTWAIMPDLVLIDGGKGQLNAAREIFKELNIGTVSLASLAKENEEVFIPEHSQPVFLARSSLGLKLLQRLRDEAHRFAITYYQKVHKKRAFTSVLDEIPGIGPGRKKALIQWFGSVQGIRDASMEELATVKNISLALAKKIKELI
jgi:excinuclease ABC subunit C